MTLRLHVANRTLTDGDKTAHLINFGVRLIELLAPKYPDYVTKSRLFPTLAKNDEPCDENYFSTQLFYVRNKIKAAGIQPVFDSRSWHRIRLLRPVEIEGYPADVIPSHHHKLLRDLLYSHPNKSGADRIIACLDG